MQVYSANLITADNWLYGIKGGYGIIGMGPYSKLWNGFADPSTLTVTYSLELARILEVSTSDKN